ncbi:hypothetical protein ACFL53_04450 [Pseudomonadota bacterium]
MIKNTMKFTAVLGAVAAIKGIDMVTDFPYSDISDSTMSTLLAIVIIGFFVIVALASHIAKKSVKRIVKTKIGNVVKYMKLVSRFDDDELADWHLNYKLMGRGYYVDVHDEVFNDDYRFFYSIVDIEYQKRSSAREK